MALADTARLVASLELKDQFTGPAKKAEGSLDRLTSKTSTLGRISGQAAQGVGTLAHNLGNIAAIGVGAAVAGLVFSVNAASNLEESLSKVNVVFGESADEIEAWASTAAASFGSSKQQALEAAGTFGNLFRAFGLADKPTQEMSTNLVELAADLASFNNTSVDDALLALRSGLSGETEPLKRFGVSLTEARLKEEALRLGLIKTTKTALTPAQKAQAAYAVILHDTALAQGDFDRTSGGLANQQRILKAQLSDTAATIGTALLPKITELAVKFNELLTENQDTITDLANKLPGLFDTVAAIVQNLPWEAMGTAFGIMGEGLLAILDAFSKFPPELQTTIIALAGINKLTGGAVTSIASELGKGLIKGVLGMTAAVVNLKAGTVVGGGGTTPGVPPVVAGRLPTGAQIVSGLVTLGVFTAIATTIGQVVADNVTRPLDPIKFDFNAIAGASGNFNTQAQAEAFAQSLATEVGLPLEDVKKSIVLAVQTQGLTFDEAVQRLEGGFKARDTASRSEAERRARNQQQRLDAIRDANLANNRVVTALAHSADVQIRTQAAADAERRAEAVRALQAQSAAQVKLQQIADKDFRPTITVGVTSNVSITDITRRLMQQHMSITAGSIGGT